MANIKQDIEDIHESSLDNSSEGEYVLAEEHVYGSSVEKSHLAPLQQHYLEAANNVEIGYKEIPTYKLIPVATEDTIEDVNMSNSTARDTFYVISNPTEVFSAQTVAPKKNHNIKKEPVTKVVTAKKRDDKRRATHNEVERRRRDKINTWIMNLANLVPNSGLPDAGSKGGILAKACEYIAELTEKQKRLEKLEVENEKLMLEVLRLNQELVDLRKDNSAMRNQLADNCIVFNTKQKGQKS